MATPRIKRKVKMPDGASMATGEAIVFGLEQGMFLKDAAAAAGIAESTVHSWSARGQNWINPENGERLASIPKKEMTYVEFVESLTRARASVVAVALAGIIEAGKLDWRAYAWYLERTRPDEYGRRTRFDVGGSGDGEGMTLAELLVDAAAAPDTADADPDLA